MKRDYSIDFIKFFALLLIINSHADICYPQYKMLATGGAIGDSLFLFCSGFTLFLGGVKRFDNYYKRRINRIYPTVFAVIVVMICMDGGLDNISHILYMGAGRPFLNAIMCYYIILYIIRKYLMNKMPIVWLTLIVIVLIAYWFFPYKMETGEKGIYGTSSLFRWIPYFGMMLMGALVGVKREKIECCLYSDTIKLFLCIVLFYGIQMVAHKVDIIAPLQIISIPFLMGICFYAYKVCRAKIFMEIYNS
ncbi:MAG: acyltransferase family protein [Bacteroidaceae bacterium]|nr:acyltransferase family protein [Bacteroidaceae bacterium]